MRNSYKILVGNHEINRPGVILEWILNKQSLRMWTGFSSITVGSRC